MRIDPHVHFRDSEQSYKETIKHGLFVAKNQNVEIVFDMPNTQRPILEEEDVVERLKLVPKNEEKRYFLYVGLTSNEEQIKRAISLTKKYKEVIGLKMFAGQSTGNLAIINEEEQFKIFKILSENNYTGVIVVHCEKESFMKNDIFNPNNPFSHTISRPKIAEVESIKDQINFAKNSNFQGILHICHISCQDSIDLVCDARKEINITCGVTPHHLMWSESMLNNSHGLLYKMNPPLREEIEVKKIRESLKMGKIDWIETDHAPHSIGEKMFDGHPSGYPSLYLYKKCVDEFLPDLGLSGEQIKKLTFENIVKTFNLKLNIIDLSEKEKVAKEKICLPLDGLNTLEEVEERVKELSDVVGYFKIGKESFTLFGLEIIRVVKENNGKVFLDLKYHDIPNTVKRASYAATKLGVEIFNVHASGGSEMMKSALEGAKEACLEFNMKMPIILGVTVLTSVDQNIMNEELNTSGEIEEQVLNLAKLVQKSGLDGIVCSAKDLFFIKNSLEDNFLFVTPGIKGVDNSVGYDQKRISSPSDAISNGSDILVIGRAITGYKTKEERVNAAVEIVKNISSVI